MLNQFPVFIRDNWLSNGMFAVSCREIGPLDDGKKKAMLDSMIEAGESREGLTLYPSPITISEDGLSYVVFTDLAESLSFYDGPLDLGRIILLDKTFLIAICGRSDLNHFSFVLNTEQKTVFVYDADGLIGIVAPIRTKWLNELCKQEKNGTTS